jgi:hypothetical protein
MGAYTYSTTAASNTTIDGIGNNGAVDPPSNHDNIARALAASQAALVRDLGGANTVAGTADAITVALADATAATAYFDGMIFSFRAASDSTSVSPTLNVDSIGAKTIKRAIAGVESALVAGDIQAGGTYTVVYRSAWASAAGAFELLNPHTINGNTVSATLTPTTSGGAALGTTSLPFSGVALASGAIINWNNGDTVLTHSADAMTWTGVTNYGIYQTGAAAAIFIGRLDTHGTATVGSLNFNGVDSAANAQAYAVIRVDVTDATSGSEDAAIYFRTVVAGTIADRGYLSHGLVMGSPTGGDKGAGTINATAVYDDNVLLTCYIGDVVDRATGEPIAVDVEALKAKWDAVVPDREIPAVKEIDPETKKEIVKEKARKETRVHDGARHFFKRLGTQYDPRDIEKAMAHFRDKGHLTSMPNPNKFKHGDMSAGEWVQRLIEQAELSLVWAYREHKRADALEARLATLEAKVG